MKIVKLLASLGVLGLGISACGTGPASVANVGTLPPIPTPAQQQVANNKDYLPMYAKFSNKVTTLGYPITVPDAIRVPLVPILAHDIQNWATPIVNGVWVGNGTYAQRMAIYTAKLFEALGAYAPTQALYNPTQLADLRTLTSVFASSPTVLNQWMSPTNPQSFFVNDNQGTVWKNDWLEASRILADKTPTLSTSVIKPGTPVNVNFCVSRAGLIETDPALDMFNYHYVAPATSHITVTVIPTPFTDPYAKGKGVKIPHSPPPQPMPIFNFAQVWKVSFATAVNGSSPC